MKKFIIVLLFSLFCFLPYNVFAYDFDNDRFKDLSIEQLMTYAYDNISPAYNQFVCVQYSSTYLDCYFGKSDYPLVLVENSSTDFRFRYIVDNSIHTNVYPVYLRFQVPNNAASPIVSTRPYATFNTSSFNVASMQFKYANYDVLDYTSNEVYFQKNVDFTPPSIEECEECEECDNVNIDFPITKEEFYILLVFLAVIILLIFFKWTFGERGRK